MFHILLYYKLVKIQHPDTQKRLHKEVCKALGLTGRILLSDYGINGTVSGTKEQIEMYKRYMNEHRVFSDIDFKESTSEFNPFPRLMVKVREEIVTTEAKDQLHIWNRGKHINRDTFHEWLKNGEDIVLLDMRNDYEWEVGRFVNSVRPPMKYFRDLKDNMEFYDQFKGKKIVMFCTGGIRCEPASAMFLSHGFDPENLYQLEGGIVKYAEKYGKEGFYEGKCFVFDDRIAISVGDNRITGSCLHCTAPTDIYHNCANKFCNKLFLSCDACNSEYENTCSAGCQQMVVESPTNARPPRVHEKVLHRNK